jgi:hypothetical protein
MSSLYFLLLCSIGAFIIHLWFYSDFFAYYVKSIKIIIPRKIYNWLLIEEYLNNQDPNLSFDSYIEYLYVQKSLINNFKIQFFLKLFSCIICFTTWISIAIAIILHNILSVGLAFIVLRILDFILRYTLKKSI